MKKMLVMSLVTVLFCAVGSLVAQEAKESESTEIKLEKVDYVSAATVDFKKELGVAFPGLLTLGVRVEQAAKDLDPVGLAAAGLELKAYETAAGKTAANYKADDVIERAVDLAVAREVVAELIALKALLPAQAEALDKAVKVAEASKGETKRDHKNYFIRFQNRHGEGVRVTFNGRFLGVVPDGWTQTYRIHIHDCGWLRVYCDDDPTELIYQRELHVEPGISYFNVYLN